MVARARGNSLVVGASSTWRATAGYRGVTPRATAPLFGAGGLRLTPAQHAPGQARARVARARRPPRRGPRVASTPLARAEYRTHGAGVPARVACASLRSAPPRAAYARAVVIRVARPRALRPRAFLCARLSWSNAPRLSANPRAPPRAPHVCAIKHGANMRAACAHCHGRAEELILPRPSFSPARHERAAPLNLGSRPRPVTRSTAQRSVPSKRAGARLLATACARVAPFVAYHNWHAPRESLCSRLAVARVRAAGHRRPRYDGGPAVAGGAVSWGNCNGAAWPRPFEGKKMKKIEEVKLQLQGILRATRALSRIATRPGNVRRLKTIAGLTRSMLGALSR